eukprot:SAG31_NODE_193_length_20735_cov_15.125509_1_plen_164_part_00
MQARAPPRRPRCTDGAAEPGNPAPPPPRCIHRIYNACFCWWSLAEPEHHSGGGGGGRPLDSRGPTNAAVADVAADEPVESAGRSPTERLGRGPSFGRGKGEAKWSRAQRDKPWTMPRSAHASPSPFWHTSSNSRRCAQMDNAMMLVPVRLPSVLGSQLEGKGV